MLVPALIAILSVGMGALLALIPRSESRWLGPISSFALMAVLGVVFTHLLPEAIGAAGLGAAVVFLVALWLPRAIGAFAAQFRRHEHERSDVRLHGALAALLLHQVGDGLGLGSYAGLLSGEVHAGVLTALAAHTIPVVALIVLAYRSAYGFRPSLAVALSLALATLLGVAGAGLAPLVLKNAAGWMAAAFAGLFLHVVTHDLEARSPSSTSSKLIDFGAAICGAFVGIWGNFISDEMHPEHPGGAQALGLSLYEQALQVAPFFLLGLLLSLGHLLLIRRRASPERVPREPVRAALRGITLGFRSAIASCSKPGRLSEVIGGKRPADFALSALVALPMLGVLPLVLSSGLLGFPFTIGYSVLVAVSAVTSALVAARFAPTSAGIRRPNPERAAGPLEDEVEAEPEPAVDAERALVHPYATLMRTWGPWMFVGVLVAALAQSLLSAVIDLSTLPVWSQFAILTVLALPVRVCAPAILPLSSVWVSCGGGPGALVVLLLLGLSSNLPALSWLERLYGRRCVLVWVSLLVLMSWAMGALVQVAATRFGWAFAELRPPLESVPRKLALLILVAAMLQNIGSVGVRRWVSGLFQAHGCQKVPSMPTP